MSTDLESLRRDYLLEAFRAAREEELFRVRHRDTWLKLELLAQVVIWALASSVQIAGVGSSTPRPEVLAAAGPVALVLALMYHVEDSLVRHLNRFIKGLAAPGKTAAPFDVFDASSEIVLYEKHTLKWRFISQLFAFLVLPLFLTALRLRTLLPASAVAEFAEIAVTVASYFVIAFVLISGFMARRRASADEKKPGAYAPEEKSGRRRGRG